MKSLDEVGGKSVASMRSTSDYQLEIKVDKVTIKPIPTSNGEKAVLVDARSIKVDRCKLSSCLDLIELLLCEILR